MYGHNGAGPAPSLYIGTTVPMIIIIAHARTRPILRVRTAIAASIHVSLTDTGSPSLLSITFTEVRAVALSITSAATVVVVALLRNESARYDAAWRILLATAVAFSCVFSGTPSSVLIVAVAGKLKDKHSNLFSLRYQCSLLLALATLALRLSLQPRTVFRLASAGCAQELAKRRLSLLLRHLSLSLSLCLDDTSSWRGIL